MAAIVRHATAPTFLTIHPNVNHAATFASAPVTLFATNQHQGAGPGGPFAALVDCGTCHTNNLPAIHGNDCATCHPSPYNTLTTSWNGGCQQGGCHVAYHQDATVVHVPFDNDNYCTQCHDDATWNVTQDMCLNCHADAGQITGDVTPPETFCDALVSYIGTAKISFSMVDEGKVGVGRTFYRLDGGDATAAGKYLFVTAPGPHTLEYWSMDQAGNTEAPAKTANFTVIADNTPPTTGSDAQGAYNESALITLTATDDSTLGVRYTFFKLNGGDTQAGTTVSVTQGAVGTFNYTLDFWSEDWGGQRRIHEQRQLHGNGGSAKRSRFAHGAGDGYGRFVHSDLDHLGDQWCDVCP